MLSREILFDIHIACGNILEMLSSEILDILIASLW